MKLISEKIINKNIKENFDYSFNLEEDSVYLIEIIASAKSWYQNTFKLVSFFKDDNLAVKINAIEFPKLNNKEGLFDGEIAWNGNNLKGLLKTCVFVTSLNKGKHVIQFLVKQKPFLKSIKISQVEDSQKIVYIPMENNPAQDGNRRQWLNFVLINLKKAKSLNIYAKANYYKGEDDNDIKLIINGKIQKNYTNKAHRNCYWCGRVLKGKEKEFFKDLESDKFLQYIELWADRKPFLYKVEVNLENKETKRIPTVYDPKWTGDWKDDSEQMILARVVYGEARGELLSDKLRIAVAWSVKNRVISPQWKNDYHNVILEELQYSCFNDWDKNFPFVKDPLSDSKDAWENCYKIAGQVISGELDDPTDGANHYFSEFIDYPEWTKSHQAEFKIKIDNSLFYDLDWRHNGFSKLLLVLIVIVLFFLGGIFYKTFAYNNNKEVVDNIFKNEYYNHFFINPKTEEINKLEFDKDGNFLRFKQITDNGYPKSQLKRFSEDKDVLGYFQDLHKKDAPRDENYYENNVSLMIMKDENSEPYEIYQGDYHTSYWKFGNIDNKTAIVYYNCGTLCLYAYEINIDTKEIEKEYHVYK